MTRLWEKGDEVDAAVLRLTVGRDPEFDLHLVDADCRASAAHAKMLRQIGILSADECARICGELNRTAADARQSRFTIDPDDEDGHTAIENRLTDRLGEAGRKIHTGRSRNDQVIAALRIWGRNGVLDQVEGVLAVAHRLLALAEEHDDVTVPGYTHTRQAMPTTLGHHFAAWASNLLDNLPWLERSFAHLNRSPLGSAAGFGVALALDRQMVADLLGFETLQVSTLSVQNDRGKSEYLATGIAAAVATDLGRLAADLILYSADEFGYLTLPTAVTTGSSIMPQKRNPDVLELIRAGAARVRARHTEIGSIYGSLTAGYHRDLQLTKEPFLESMQGLIDMLRGLGPVLVGLQVNDERCRDALLTSTGATDVAYRQVKAGLPFRDAYRAAAGAAEAGEGVPQGWRKRAYAGAPGNLALGGYREEGARWHAWLNARRQETDLEHIFD